MNAKEKVYTLPLWLCMQKCRMVLELVSRYLTGKEVLWRIIYNLSLFSLQSGLPTAISISNGEARKLPSVPPMENTWQPKRTGSWLPASILQVSSGLQHISVEFQIWTCSQKKFLNPLYLWPVYESLIILVVST